MIDGIVTAILNEGGWFVASLGLAFAAVVGLLVRLRGFAVPGHHVALAALNLSAGTTVGCMAAGHLLAVTTKLLLGTLDGSAPIVYAIGLGLAAPSFGILVHTVRLTRGTADPRATVRLHTWLAATLLILGLPNLPLAIPSVLTLRRGIASRDPVGDRQPGRRGERRSLRRVADLPRQRTDIRAVQRHRVASRAGARPVQQRRLESGPDHRGRQSR